MHPPWRSRRIDGWLLAVGSSDSMGTMPWSAAGWSPALLRWQHPSSRPATTFIAVAQASGLIQELGRWIIEHVNHAVVAELGSATCRRGPLGGRCSVPRARSRSRSPSIMPAWTPPLELEFTESGYMGRDDPMRPTWRREEIQQPGPPRLAIGDLGTGWARSPA